MWNPEVYLSFADHRGRPFVDLVARIGADAPRRVVDLGCGPGNLTTTLSRRWPSAVIEAWDNSPEMVAAARERGVDAELGDVRDWTPQPDTDVVLSNATLHWVSEHPQLLTRWAAALAPGSWVAMQVPGNFDAPSHESVRRLANEEPWAALLHGIPFAADNVVETPAGYAGLLTDAGCTVDAWETTYVHELTGDHPVLDWITGTALRPVRSRLTDAQWDDFRAELIPLLDEAYPARPDGRTFFPFRRVFVVARTG
ncbi:trans-aconitate 2-methyltransferase [Mycolicibacterium litorale]|uniref:Trans-aconitate 2-methyltransferase n=1 Tax=Mycolicibacterium litorale TaxID=758802 RepID=A0AAD1IN29_9MYCO|nr:trans-aconitate 2-methyltransferase [Mycolicibacterium litorale]MCV7416956.1 trans-aconitate 2-methyltransferase [Mycolicibacterium litorale]TDY04741.1 trans-aconitate 2-methyltransferase [Mycolicibacterium litorale]BBY18169.1 putative trans-aconitate 2-methyltransferase [Mycolicibacterium litorale]